MLVPRTPAPGTGGRNAGEGLEQLNYLSYPRVRAAVVLLLAAATAACSGAIAPSSAPSEDENARSHEQMLALLQQVREQAAIDNPYLGVDPIPEIEQQLAGLPEGTPDLRRWLFHKLLGRHKLRMGRYEESIEHYIAANQQLQIFGSEIPPHEQLDTRFETAVAFLRLGETENCALRHTPESCILPIRGGGVHTATRGSESAIPFLIDVMRTAPPGAPVAIKAGWLLNIAYMTLGMYPDEVPDGLLIPLDKFASDVEFPRFVDAAPGLGLSLFDLAGGAVVDDFDGDGLPDIVVSTSDTAGQMHYYRNAGDGTFVERTEDAGLVGQLGGLNMSSADYDNDGDVDLYVLRGGWWRALGRHPNSLLRNDGQGRFTDVTLAAGLGKEHYPTQTADWADYDNDGDLDLYVGNEFAVMRQREGQPDLSIRAPSQLFRNDGNGRFTDVAVEAGVTNERYAKAVSWGDYDNDRFPDLYVSNLNGENRLYHNNGDGTFTDVAREAGVTEPIASFPTWFWDYDNDGMLDLFVAAYGGKQMVHDVSAVAASYLGIPHPGELPQLYRGNGQGAFESVGAAAGLHIASLPMGSNFGDLNNDGYPDFYLGTGYPHYEALMPNIMYLNQAGQSFADITTAGGFGHLQKGHAVVFVDLDNDGDQDVFEQIGGAYPGDSFGNVLFENPGFDAHWIKIRLVGEQSNRHGIGARIRIDVVDGGAPRTIHTQVGTGGSFGARPMRQEIGLGAATRIERLEVYWPTSDTTQVFDGVDVDGQLTVREGVDELDVAEVVATPFRAGADEHAGHEHHTP
ncbi:MAG: CRTAC1 family protein [bacterium]|nr:CRTAC1 family protein [bacterium]